MHRLSAGVMKEIVSWSSRYLPTTYHPPPPPGTCPSSPPGAIAFQVTDHRTHVV